MNDRICCGCVLLLLLSMFKLKFLLCLHVTCPSNGVSTVIKTLTETCVRVYMARLSGYCSRNL